LLLIDDADLEVRAKANKLIADQIPNKDLSSLIQSQNYNENMENKKNKLKDTLVKIKQIKEIENASQTRLNSIPKNSTIREEFIKCGKDRCNLCPHGPYYYAYWKDKSYGNKSKLIKKYLGVMDPRC
jgi:hypothetical protein